MSFHRHREVFHDDDDDIDDDVHFDRCSMSGIPFAEGFQSQIFLTGRWNWIDISLDFLIVVASPDDFVAAIFLRTIWIEIKTMVAQVS